MVFDLGLAMRKKEEFETSRLMDFEFRRRARATRFLSQSLRLDPSVAADLVATLQENEVPAQLAELAGVDEAGVWAEYQKWLRVVHQQLVAERGDPTPHRLG